MRPDMKESTMRMRAIGLPLIGIGLAGALALVVWADEVELTLDQVPDAVKATILRESAGGRITEIERETKNGVTVYEAEFMLHGDEIEIRIAPDGTLLGRAIEREGDDEDDLALRDVPEPVRAALHKAAGGARIAAVSRERERGVLVYEAAWHDRGLKHEAAVTADGALLELETTIPLDQAPAAVQAAIAKHFGPDVKVVVEKKMIVVYEAEAKIDGKEHEILIFPTGQVHDAQDGDDDEDDDDDDDD
jgi:uncharacterized membrane protein YkoI